MNNKYNKVHSYKSIQTTFELEQLEYTDKYPSDIIIIRIYVYYTTNINNKNTYKIYDLGVYLPVLELR